MILFVSGTDTGVGKTNVTCAIASRLRRRGWNVGVCKPVATGAVRRGKRRVSSDAMRLLRAAGRPMSDYADANPVLFDPPVSPHLAARQARRPIRLGPLRRRLINMERRFDILLVEGIGGVATPLTAGATWADFLSGFRKPRTVLVCSPRVGTLNHTLMSLEYLGSRGVECVSVVLSKYDGSAVCHSENRRELARLTGRPIVICSSSARTVLSGDVMRLETLFRGRGH